MPLHDHFRPPLSDRRHWHAFHNAWATYLAADLNARLPEGYFAEANVQFGIEIDVAAFDDRGLGVAEPAAAWPIPAPTQTVPVSLPRDVVEVLVFDRTGGPNLAGAIELVSPANKDRPDHRAAFVSKCVAYLHQGAGLVIVDVVTERKANLHDELLSRLKPTTTAPSASDLYTVAYRLVQREEETSLDVWQQPLVVGQALPTMPLWLRGGLCLPVELNATYDRTCREQRIVVEESSS